MLTLFRKGNKLMKRAVNSHTCPIDMSKHERAFEEWLEQQPNGPIKAYFTASYGRAIDQAMEEYYKPRVRGRDGFLYSAADMDDAMMTGM